MAERMFPGDFRDFERVEQLRKLSLEELEPLIPGLLVWLRTILDSDDGQWKHYILLGLVKDLPKDIVVELAPDLLRLAMNPSMNDLEEGIDELSEQVLAEIL